MLKVFTPRACVVNARNAPRTANEWAILRARLLQQRFNSIRCGPEIGWAQTIYSNDADFTAVASTNVEASLITPVSGNSKKQPKTPADFFDFSTVGRWLRMEGQGVFSTTATPTLIFNFRMGTSSTWASSDTAVGVTAAITTASGISNKYFKFVFDLFCTIPGDGTNGMTVVGCGEVRSPSGFATPFEYPIEPTTPDTATWTVATLDGGLTYFFRPSVTWSASSSSNTITLKRLTIVRML